MWRENARPRTGLGPGPQTRGWGPAEFTSAGAGENPPKTEARGAKLNQPLALLRARFFGGSQRGR